MALSQIKLAATFKIPFLATGGRHGYTTTLGRLDWGVEIDLGQFNQVKVDKSAATLTIGGGVVFADIFDPVYDAGFTLGECTFTRTRRAGEERKKETHKDRDSKESYSHMFF